MLYTNPVSNIYFIVNSAHSLSVTGFRFQLQTNSFSSQVVVTPSKSTTETIHSNIKPSCPPVEGWTPKVEKQISSLAINSQTPTYHIDLSKYSKSLKSKLQVPLKDMTFS